RLHLADFRFQGGRGRDRHRQHDPTGFRNILVAGRAAGIQAADCHHRETPALRACIEALGARGDGLTSEIWWTPNHPFKSGLTGQSCRDLTDAYTKASSRPWTQPL